MTAKVLAILARAAMDNASVAGELKRLAYAGGVTEEAWESMTMTLAAPLPDPAAIAQRLEESDSPTSTHSSSSASHGEWMAVEPRDDDPQWNDGDTILFRFVEVVGGVSRREFMVVDVGKPVPTFPGSNVLRTVKK